MLESACLAGRMTDPSHPQSAPGPRRAPWTAAKQRIFLAALVEYGRVTHAARVAGMSRSSAARLRAKLAGTPFDRDWDRCLAMHAAQLADPLRADDAPAARR